MNRGLQRERTSLAWTRTALALVGNGLLVLVRHEHSFPLGVAVALSSFWLGLALLLLWYANRRSQLVSMPDHEIGAAYGLVVSLGIAVAMLCAATALAIAWT